MNGGDRPFVGNWLTNSRANRIGLNLPAMRAHDIVRGVDLLATRGDVDPTSICAVARGVKGIWLLLAAASRSKSAQADSSFTCALPSWAILIHWPSSLTYRPLSSTVRSSSS